jgi:enoyl-[acyl-carrier protein] reductase III
MNVARTALVTGGSRGIGRRVAETLAAEGMHVVLTYRRSADAAAEVVRGIESSGGTATAVRLELESADDIRALFDSHLQDGPDVLVANAAASAFRAVADFSATNLERSWATNVRSFVLLAQAAVPVMRPGGSIVALSSYGSIRTFPGYGAIGADKAAIESWVRHMAAEFGALGIRVNAVNGGLIDTDSLEHYLQHAGFEPIEESIAHIPLGRLGTADDMAAAVSWLAGAASGYVTGQVIVVDGGLTIVAPPYLPKSTR